MSLLGLFFPKYRPLIHESWRCFWYKLRLRPCEMEFDKKVKATIVSKLIKRDREKLANFVNKYFDLALTIFGLLIMALMIYSTWLFIKWVIIGNSPCSDGTCSL
jgi:hypothetical protein